MFRLMSLEEVEFINKLEKKGYRVHDGHDKTYVSKMVNCKQEHVLEYKTFDGEVDKKGEALPDLKPFNLAEELSFMRETGGEEKIIRIGALEDIYKIIDTGEPYGLYFYEDNHEILAVDNAVGDAWVKPFRPCDKKYAEKWLRTEMQYSEYEQILLDLEEKNNPMLLITDAMRKVLPRQYDTQNIAFKDKIVQAIYFIPLKSRWSWYMVEYDKASNTAFGLVTGDYPEWGYFSLSELEALGAQRLLCHIPKKFEEIKETELKKQLTSDELHQVFSGALSYDEVKAAI